MGSAPVDHDGARARRTINNRGFAASSRENAELDTFGPPSPRTPRRSRKQRDPRLPRKFSRKSPGPGYYRFRNNIPASSSSPSPSHSPSPSPSHSPSPSPSQLTNIATPQHAIEACTLRYRYRKLQKALGNNLPNGAKKANEKAITSADNAKATTSSDNQKTTASVHGSSCFMIDDDNRPIEGATATAPFI